MKRPLMTSGEVAALCGIHPETARRWARQGRLPFLKIGGEIRFDRSEIEGFIERRKARLLFDCPPPLLLGLAEFDRLHLKGGQAALSSKNSGRWRYAIGRIYLRRTKKGLDRWLIDYRGPEGQRIREVVKAAQSRGEALAALQDRIRKIFDGKYQLERKSGSVKFSELADIYVEEARKAGKRSWKTDEYRLVRLRKHFGEIEIGRITTSAILDYREPRLRAGISELTTNRERALLSVMFNLAIEKGLTSENPASKVRRFSEKDTARDRVLAADEEQRLFAELPPALRPLVLAALHTGLRYRELLNLRWNDVDFERRTLKIEHTKSGKARFIPINAVLLGVLEKLKADHREGKLVFSIEPRSVRTGFESARKKAQLEDFTFHDLRRSFGTRLLERGVNIVTIAKLYGHSSVLVTQNYLHPRDELSREAVNSLVEGSSKPAETAENLAQNWHTERKAPASPLARSAFSVN